MSSPTQRGRLAAGNKKNFTDCPYEKGTEDYDAWIDGWWTTIQAKAKKATAKQQESSPQYPHAQ